MGVGDGVALEEPLGLEVLLEVPPVDVLPLLLGAVVVPDVPVVLGLADLAGRGAVDLDGASSVVADDSGVPTFTDTRTGEGAADPVTVGTDRAGVVAADCGSACERVDVECLAGFEEPRALARAGATGSALGARSAGAVLVASGVVEADVRRVGALVVLLSEAAFGPSSTKPPAVTATASAPPAASPLPTRAGRICGSRPTRAGPGCR